MSDSSIIIMSSPVKVIIMNGQYNTSVRCNSTQSGATTSRQMYQYQVIAYQPSSVRYQVLSDNMSCTDVSIKCQDQVSSINISVSGN